jgi:hypothetical protein
MTSYRITFLTPLFSKGSYDDRPEIRPPSIRGQLHWWFRALGYSYADEMNLFGGVHGGAKASRVVVRVGGIDGTTGEVATLPHKLGGQSSPKAAFKSGTSFDLHLSARLGGLTSSQSAALDRTVKAWLLAGTLGLRGTRAAGSFQWAAKTEGAFSMPTDSKSWQAAIDEVFNGAPLKIMLLEKPFETAEAARKVASDTIGGRDDYQGQDNLSNLNQPLGFIGRGRKTSPLRFRVIPIESKFRILAVWDDRSNVTGNRTADLSGVAKALADKGKEIGHALVAAVR